MYHFVIVAVIGMGLCLGSSARATTYTDDTASNVTTQSTVTRVSTGKTVSVIQGRIAGSRSAGARRTSSGARKTGAQASALDQAAAGRSGDAAGDDPLGLGVWTSVGYSGIKDDHSSTETGGDVYYGAIGADYAITDHFVAGAAVSYDVLDLETGFNLGTQDSYGVGISPYLSVAISDFLSVNTIIGYAHTWGDMTRRAGAVEAGALVTANHETDRYFTSVQVDGYYDIGDFSIGANTGVLLAQEHTYSFVESNGARISGTTSKLGTYSAGLTGSHFLDISTDLFLEPYLSYTYSTDFMRDDIKVSAGLEEHANDHDAHTIGAGLNIYINDTMSGGLDFRSEYGRQKQESYSGTVSFRIQF